VYSRGMEESPEDRLADVRKNVARYRKEQSLSQADLAEKVSSGGIKFFPQTVQKIENGTRTIRLDEAMAIAEALGMSMGEFLRSESSPLADLEHAIAASRFGREQGVGGLVDWLDARETLVAALRRVESEDTLVGVDEVEPRVRLVMEARQLAQEDADALYRAAVERRRESEEWLAAEIEKDSIDHLRKLIGDDDGVDQEAP